MEFTDALDHLYSLRGIWWAEWLARTSRRGPAEVLASRNAGVCHQFGWSENGARCSRLLGRLALAAGATETAGEYLWAAANRFRDGDYLPELGITLADLAGYAQSMGDLDAAERHVAEAITIAPRRLMPAHCATLVARACIRANQASGSANPDLLYQGREAADAALRLAVRHHLPWYELDALHAHALLDRAECTDHEWSAKADILHNRLLPPDLDPDPLAAVERFIANQPAADPGHEEDTDWPP